MGAPLMGSSAKAVVKDAVYYGSGESCSRAPRGEYDIEQRSDCIGFCNCAGENAFTLSFDAFIQHLNEGRISIVA